MQTPVAVFGTLRFPAERLPEVLPHLRRLVDATRELDGCLAYDVALDPFEPGLLRFSERWPDQARLDAHFRQPHIDQWREATRALGVHDRSFTAYEIGAARSL